MIWENGIKTCIISYMKRVTSPGSMHDTGCLGLVHWDGPEGWYGEGGGRREEGSGWGTRAYLWCIHVDIWQNQYSIVKLKNTIKKKKKNFQQNGEGGWLRGHPARCDAAPSLRIVLPLSVTTEILCNLNRLSWQHRCHEHSLRCREM